MHMWNIWFGNYEKSSLNGKIQFLNSGEPLYWSNLIVVFDFFYFPA